MYLDLSLKKIMMLAVILTVLSISVAFTLAAKISYFGTTPYAYSAILGTRYALDTLFGNFQQAAPRMYAAVLAVFDKGTPEEVFSAQEPARGIPVLTYHRIVTNPTDQNNVTTARFKNQMQTLKANGWQTVSLRDFESFMRGEKDLPEKSFLITFDDGAKESFYPVDPILGALDYTAVIFIIAQAAENAQNLGSIYYLSPPEIKRMLNTGRWDIGSHSFDGHHPYPVDESGHTGIFFADRIWNEEAGRLETPEEFRVRVYNDLALSKQILESQYGVPIESFAFPLGNETGIEGANNFTEGSKVTEDIAKHIFKFGHLQLEDQTFTLNFPPVPGMSELASTTSELLSTRFAIRRVHVDYDWDGERLLRILENSLPKELPYEDDFRTDNGWISAWGTLDVGRNNFILRGETESNASTFLDGTALWDNYSFDAAVNWQDGDFFVLADVVNAQTYDSCAFSPGRVRILSTKNGQVTELNDVRNPSIQFGNGVRMGIRVHGSTIECTWNFRSIAEVYSRAWSGGIGFQMWDNTPGTEIQITSLIARPLGQNVSPTAAP